MRLGPDLNACAVSILAAEPLCPEQYKALIPEAANIAHATVEIHRPAVAGEI